MKQDLIENKYLTLGLLALASFNGCARKDDVAADLNTAALPSMQRQAGSEVGADPAKFDEKKILGSEHTSGKESVSPITTTAAQEDKTGSSSTELLKPDNSREATKVGLTANREPENGKSINPVDVSRASPLRDNETGILVAVGKNGVKYIEIGFVKVFSEEEFNTQSIEVQNALLASRAGGEPCRMFATASHDRVLVTGIRLNPLHIIRVIEDKVDLFDVSAGVILELGSYPSLLSGVSEVGALIDKESTAEIAAKIEDFYKTYPGGVHPFRGAVGHLAGTITDKENALNELTLLRSSGERPLNGKEIGLIIKKDEGKILMELESVLPKGMFLIISEGKVELMVVPEAYLEFERKFSTIQGSASYNIASGKFPEFTAKAISNVDIGDRVTNSGTIRKLHSFIFGKDEFAGNNSRF